jgi:hypothetical protein
MNISNVALLLSGVVLAGVVATSDIAAQGRNRGGQGPANYNAASEITVKGTVEDFKPGPEQGVHIVLKTSDATVELAVGPPWYQTEKKYVIAKGDQLEVIGAKAQADGRQVLLVREIKKGTQTMTFRDAKGFPLWAGRGRG